MDAEVRKKAEADKYAEMQKADAELYKRQKEAEAKLFEQEKDAAAIEAVSYTHLRYSTEKPIFYSGQSDH